MPCSPLGNLSHPGIKPTFLMFPALAGRFFNTSTTWKGQILTRGIKHRFKHIGIWGEQVKMVSIQMFLRDKLGLTYTHSVQFGSVLVIQSCLTACDPVDYSPPGSSAHGILQAKILEWVAISISRRSSQPRNQTWVSHVAGRYFSIWATWEATIEAWKYTNIAQKSLTICEKRQMQAERCCVMGESTEARMVLL